MKTNLPIILLCSVFLSLPCAAWQSDDRLAVAEEAAVKDSIAVHLTDGRSFTARIDARTDNGRLWLRWQRAGAVLLRPIDWVDVERANVAGQDISGKEFHALVAAIRKDVPARPQPQVMPGRIVIKGSGDDSESATAEPAAEPSARRPLVRALAIDAVVANWDSDVNVDGLLVTVYPLDALGRVVPVRGTLAVDLIAERWGIVERRQPFHRLGVWTRAVRQEDFEHDGATYRLPFQRVHPEFDTAIAPYAAVHARLTVPGQGTFEATAATVRIRPSSVVRDRLEQSSGRRFFPHERINRR